MIGGQVRNSADGSDVGFLDCNTYLRSAWSVSVNLQAASFLHSTKLIWGPRYDSIRRYSRLPSLKLYHCFLHIVKMNGITKSCRTSQSALLRPSYPCKVTLLDWIEGLTHASPHNCAELFRRSRVDGTASASHTHAPIQCSFEQRQSSTCQMLIGFCWRGEFQKLKLEWLHQGLATKQRHCVTGLANTQILVLVV